MPPSTRRGCNDDETVPTPLNAHSVLAHATSELERQLNLPLEAGLYVVATPIGNLGDFSLRAISVLARADTIYCEDTRHSAKLLQHFSIATRTRPFHEHNEDAMQRRILDELGQGARIALISDAGTPLISDPGFKLVRACADAAFPVMSIPGPSALTSALSVSGLPTDAFFFAGFLPPKSAARRTRLAELGSVPGTLVFFEAPQRIPESLADMSGVLGERRAVIARELSKLHEETRHGSLSELATAAPLAEAKGEIVILVGPAGKPDISDLEIRERLEMTLGRMRLKDAAAAVADALGVSKSRVYNVGLQIKDGQS